MDLYSITFREIQRRPGRAILTVLSIVIGVAAVISVSLAISESRRTYRQMYQIIAGRAALEVVAEGGGSFSASVAGKIADIPGVHAAVSTVQNFTILRRQGRRYQLLVMGIDLAKDAQVRNYKLTAGRFFQDSDEVMLESGFAHAADININDELRFLTHRGIQKMTVSGLLVPQEMSGFSQAGTVYMPLSSAQQYFRRPGQVDTVSIVLDEKANQADLEKSISASLPVGLKVREPADRTRLGRDVFINAEQGLRFAGALTLTLAVFIILNTFMMNVSERKRQLAILRTIGATHYQIELMMLGEALTMGVVGTILGIPMGLLGAKFLFGAMSLLRGSPMPPLQWSTEPLLLAAGLGPGMAILGAYLPARLAGTVSPLSGIRAPVLFDSRKVSLWMTLAGMTLFTLSGLLVWACIRGWLPSGVSVPAGVVFLASFALVIPVLLRPVGRVIAIILSPWLGVEAELAETQLTRRGTRCGLAAGVLYIAVAAGVGLGTTILNNVQDVRNWYRKTMVGDFFVRAMFPDQATGVALPMPDSFGDDISKIEGVASVERVRFVSADIRKTPVILITREFDKTGPLPLDIAEGKPDDVRQGLFEGKVVVSAVLSRRLGIKIGDQIDLNSPKGPAYLSVAGISTDFGVGGLAMYMERTAARGILQIDGADAFAIHAERSMRDSVNKNLHAYCEEHGLLLHSYGEFSAIVDRIMSGVLDGLWGLLALGFAVAGFGIANTLTMNVLEQTREIGLLRAIAMTRQQVRKMVLTEAAMIAIIGLLVGMFAGVNTAYIIGLCMLPLLGYTVPFVLHPLLFLGIIPVVLVIVLASAWIPMQRAAGLDLLTALSYE